MYSKLVLVLLFMLSAGITHEAYAHGIGPETLSTQNLGDREVYMQVSAMALESNIDQQFTFELLDKNADNVIKEVTYEIHASKQEQILFDEKFQSSSGTLVFDLINSDEIKIEKSKGIFGFMAEDIVRVTGPYFDRGGLYEFEIKIHSVDKYSNQLDPPLIWKAGISIADTTKHTINDPIFGEQDLYHTTYYDLIENFRYEPKTKNITFEMPFNASLESINQTSVIHEEIAVSKEFGDLMISEISATINGVLMPEAVIAIDDFSEMRRIIHLTVIKKNIMDIFKQDKIPDDRLYFLLGPAEENPSLATVTKNGQFRIIMKQITPDVRTGKQLEISYKIFDVFLKDKPIKVDYDLYLAQDERVLFRTHGTSNDHPDEFDSISIAVPEDVTGIVYAYFENLADNSLASAKLPIVIDRAVPDQLRLPKWIKQNAGWWAEGIVSDEEFVRGIEYLIKNDIIAVSEKSSAASESGMPKWIKQNAGWWAEGIVSDEEFVRGIEYLISRGIIRI